MKDIGHANTSGLKIAFVVTSFPVLTETFILDQIIALIDSGHQVEIFSLTRPSCSPIHPSVADYDLLKHTHYIPTVPSGKFACRLKAFFWLASRFATAPLLTTGLLKRLVTRKEGFSYKLLFFVPVFMRKKFDIAHAHFGPLGNLLASILSSGFDFKFITTFHGYDINICPQKYGHDYYDELFKKENLFTANTEFTKGQMVKLGCDENKVEILPVGLKIEKFHFRPRTLPEEGTVNILTIARLVEKKGHQYAIKAFAKVAAEYPNVHYTIVGDGPLKDELNKLVADLNLQGRITFIDSLVQDEIIDYLNDSHIFVLASVTSANGDMEGQGLVLQEAQATGLPVVSTLHNGIPDGVLDGRSGFLVPEKNVDALAEKICYLIENHTLWPEMGAVGRSFVENKYDTKLLNKKLLDIYKRALTPIPIS